MTAGEVTAILALLVSVVGLTFQWTKGILQLRERVAKLETKMELFWHSLKSQLTKVLIHPDHPEMDHILAKVGGGVDLEDEEVEILRNFLRAEAQRDDSHACAARLLEAILVAEMKWKEEEDDETS